MRALEYLMQLYPDKTAKEILEIQEADKLEDEKEFQERNAKTLAFMEDINTNTGYYRGRFGFDQHYYYRVFNMQMDSKGVVTMQVESLILFYNSEAEPHTTMKVGEIQIERRTKEYERLDQYGLQARERVTKKEWDEVNEYVNAMSAKFWDKLPK